jgi:hydrogenase maturation protein HypF
MSAVARSAGGPLARTRARVQGTVQGVGFRPFVYRIAGEEGLAGHVLNDERGVLLEVEGTAEAVDRFLARLRSDAPPLAAVDRIELHAIATRGDRGFRILPSARSGAPDALVTPDTAPCEDCLAELRDPTDRRYRYPFVNCTNCGPRFTIVRGVPYDRPLTTMATFRMCPDCRREYEDPADRRFHAQPNACPRCGPRVRVTGPDGTEVEAADPIALIAARLASGRVVAIKGLGGFHLACDADDAGAVAALRARKHREDKPFALMVPDLEAASCFVVLGDEEEALLSSIQRPIVLAARRPDAPLAAAVAPSAPELGVMLPYTPLHHLLLEDFRAASADGRSALVMTSGNVSDEPIAYEDQDALERLAPIADVFLLHDREIETRTDDSVVRVVGVGDRRRPLQLRRSRGYVPSSVALPVEATRPLLACGAEQKNTFCVAKGERAWVGHHVGDLEHYPTLHAFREGVSHFERLFAVRPQVVAHDLHPDYLSTAYALERDGVEHVGVQHHHAHLAACLAEHGHEGPAVGAIFDGTGYGTDGTVWGGELLVGGLRGFERAGSLWPVRMPGAAAAIRQPWRMAFAWLAEAFGEPQPLPARLAGRVQDARWNAMGQVGASPTVSPVTSSIGRLFDAVGALCGLAVEVSYEGQAAVELEAAAAVGGGATRWAGARGARAARGAGSGAARGGGAAGAAREAGIGAARGGGAGRSAREIEFALARGADGALVLDPRPALRAIAGELDAGADAGAVAAGFHAALARAAVEALVTIASEHGLDTVVLSGGVFQNRLLLEAVAASVAERGFRVLVPERLPPNDGGISYGQAAVVAARDAR